MAKQKKRTEGSVSGEHIEASGTDGSDTSKKCDRIVVVCLGASAGGLEPLRRIFEEIPPTSGMSFIVVTHLQRDRESALPDILRKAGSVKVVEASDNIKVEANQAYCIPPDKAMKIMDGRLRLHERNKEEGHLPIDGFLISLADWKGPRAVAVILSGTGHDGRDGAAAVRSAEGLVIAQDPATARFDGMPRAVIEAQTAQQVLAPEQIVPYLIQYVAEAREEGFLGETLEAAKQPLMERALQLIREQTGHDFTFYKESTVFRRINRRRRMTDSKDVASYVKRLEEDSDEVSTLAAEMLIGVTSFFRDTAAFEALREAVIRPLIASKEGRQSLRVWIPGAGTGQEAFSVAILIHECLAEQSRNLNVQIFATDMNAAAINHARISRYPVSIEHEMSAERLKRYFVRDGDGYRVTRDVREWLVFAAQDVTQDPAFTKMDLIVCRNLFIYLKPAVQKRLLAMFHFALNSQGYLFLGSSETIGELTSVFEVVNPAWKIFRRKDVPSARTAPSIGHCGPGRTTERPHPTPESEQQIKEAIEKDLLEAFVPPGVVVDSLGAIYYFHGRTGKYLEPAPGRPHLNVLEMARDGLASLLPGLLRQAAKERAHVSRGGVLVTAEGASTAVDVSVEPMRGGRRTESLFRIMFRESQAPIAQKPLAEPPPPEMQDELERTRQDLFATIEEYQTANEDLRSTNEEFQSANEELQSANEELETSREEMQSLNEELSTLNDELEQKVRDLTQAKEEMGTFLNCLDIPTVFLDRDLRIERFTSRASDVLNVIDTDIGRPIFHISNKLKDVDLHAHARRVLKSTRPEDIEVRDESGRWLLMRVLPFELPKSHTGGIVMSFVTIDALKKKTAEFDASEIERAYADTIVKTVREPLAVLDADLRTVSMNPAFERILDVSMAEPESRRMKTLSEGLFNDPGVLSKLGELAKDGGAAFCEKIARRDKPTLELEARALKLIVGRRILLSVRELS